MNKNFRNFLMGTAFGVLVIILALLTNGFGNSIIFEKIFLQVPVINFFDKILIWFCHIFNSYKCSAFIIADYGWGLLAVLLDFFLLFIWYGFIFMIVGKLFSWLKIKYIKK